MTPSALRIAGKNQALGSRIGGGGEGEVFTLSDTSHQAVKLYKESLRSSREHKVRAMVESRLADQTTLVAFPLEIATDGSGRFVGFSMRRVNGYSPIHQLYSPKSRKLHFPKADYRFLLRAAQNIARAVATVHQANCVIGDFNHSGVLIAQDATVALIDADSFQFSSKGRSYPCVVGTEDFTPPELHGLNLGTVERTQAHDNFGLAVAIFQLLGMGKHPYAGRYEGADLSLGQAIAQHRFAYSIVRRSATRTTPPPGAVELNDFSKPMAEAFEAAFGLEPAKRPSPATWVALLKEFELQLRRCSNVSSHYFFPATNECVWCRIAHRSGVEMFPAGLAAIPSSTDAPFDLARITGAIQSTPIPRPEEVVPTWSEAITRPSPLVQRVQRAQKLRRAFGIGLVPVMLAAFAWAPNLIVLWGVICFVAYSVIRTTNRQDASLKNGVVQADDRVRKASLAYLQRTGYLSLYNLRNELMQCVSQVQTLEHELARNVAQLQTTREERQRNDYLDTFLIRDAKIAGIGRAKTTALASFGIESAADITYQAVIIVPGFGESLTKKLLQWRQSHLTDFRYSTVPTQADQQAEQVVRAAAATKRNALHNRLRQGLATLQNGPSRLAQHKATSDPVLIQALRDRAQAEYDCTVLGITPPPPAPLQVPIPPLTPAPVIRPISSPTGTSTSARTTSPAPSSMHAIRTPSPTASPPSLNTPPPCPICHSVMRRLVAKSGVYKGRPFWGCSKYPVCTGKRSI